MPCTCLFEKDRDREARLQCQETQNQIQASGRHCCGLGAAGQHWPCATEDDIRFVKNDRAPGKRSWQGWGLPRDQSGFSPACHRPSRSQRNACFQRKLQDSQRLTSSLAQRHPSLPVREEGGYPQWGLTARLLSKGEHRSYGPQLS